MSALQDLFDRWVGDGRRIPAEDFAREAEYSARAVYRWISVGATPPLNAIRNMLASVALPIDFRRELAEFLTRRCVDMKVVFDPAPVRGEPHANPLRLSFDHCAALVDLQRALERALGELSDGGPEITETEHAELARGIGEVERLTAELRRAVAARANGRATKRQRA